MAKQPPAIHPKNAQTGKGTQPKTPGNASMGNSMHTPATGYTSEQQQQRT